MKYLVISDGAIRCFEPLEALRIAQVESLGAASLQEGAYHHGYCYIARLHALTEVEQIMELYESFSSDKNFKLSMKQLIKQWQLRLKVNPHVSPHPKQIFLT